MSWEVRTMRSVTSYFNPTLYKKNLARFWPMWVSWLVLWLFMLPLNLVNQWRDYSRTGDQEQLYHYLRDCLNLNNDYVGEGGVVLGAIYAVLIVMAVYGYLFNHRSAATMHALPMRRENLFLTNFLSGVTFFLLPNAVVFALAGLVDLVTLPAELSAIAMPCLWSGFWVMTGCTFFFYCFAVFCAQFTGNVLALPAFYGILNFLVWVMYNLVQTIGYEFLYGGWPFLGEPDWVRLLTPAYALIMASLWNWVSWSELWDYERNIPILDTEKLELYFADPGVIAGYAAAGVVLAVLALLVYRRRHIETAGDGEVRKVMDYVSRITDDDARNLQATFTGNYFSSRTMVWELAMVMLVAVMLLYFILAAQFESLLQPVIILAEVVIDVARVMLALFVCGETLNVMSMIGMVVMCGIIINDSILKVDTINRLYRQAVAANGVTRVTLLRSIVTAGHQRLRPIIMTSLTTILAILPLLQRGDMGSALQFPLSFTIIVGMTVGTMVSLFFVPLVYHAIYGRRWFGGK